ncbi:MAG: phosphoribosyltransferase [Candidatus Bilamarchaeum sp.]|jgi:hypoxanthine phosphoribosyltransferase
MELLKINWEIVYKYSSDVCLSIRKDKFKPDAIVALSRGGLVPSRIFSDLLNVGSILVLGLKSYDKDNKQSQIQITQEITNNLKGQKILLVDDVSDSGNSLIFAMDYLSKKGASARSATLHYKPDSKFKPDYFAQTTKSWVCYPWEVNEIENKTK